MITARSNIQKILGVICEKEHLKFMFFIEFVILLNFHKVMMEKEKQCPLLPLGQTMQDELNHSGVVAGGRTHDLGTYPCVLFDGEYAHIHPLPSLCFMSAYIQSPLFTVSSSALLPI